VSGTETTLTKIATMRHAHTRSRALKHALRPPFAKVAGGAPWLKVKLAHRRMVEVKERDYSASGGLRSQIRLS
jgi:hypothetical protein